MALSSSRIAMGGGLTVFLMGAAGTKAMDELQQKVSTPRMSPLRPGGMALCGES